MNVLKRISFNRALFGTFFLGLAALMGGLSGEILWLKIAGSCLMTPAFLAFLNIAVLGAFLEKSPVADPRDSLVVPNLPRLAWSPGCGWVCEIWLAEWDRSVSVSFARTETAERSPPKSAEIAAFADASARIPAVLAAALRTLAEHADEWPEISEYLGESLVEPSQLDSLVYPVGVRIAAAIDGDSELEVAFEFSCDSASDRGFCASVLGGRIRSIDCR